MKQDALEREFWVGYERCKAKDYGRVEGASSPSLQPCRQLSRQFTKINFPHIPPQKIQVWA